MALAEERYHISIHGSGWSIWDTWHHITFVWAGYGTDIKTYINGTRKIEDIDYNTYYNSRTLNAGDLVFGRRYVTPDSEYGSSMIDEFVAWNKPLSDWEIE